MKKKPTRVIIKPINEERFIGYIYLDDNERLQDLLNDCRCFIPIHIVSKCEPDTPMEDISFTMILMQKSCIMSIEDASKEYVT